GARTRVSRPGPDRNAMRSGPGTALQCLHDVQANHRRGRASSPLAGRRCLICPPLQPATGNGPPALFVYPGLRFRSVPPTLPDMDSAWSPRQVLSTFLDFYRERGHSLLGDATLIPPPGDPVLFTSAGMHPLTPYLEGRTHPLGRRLTGVQRCLRTTDLDEIGD